MSRQEGNSAGLGYIYSLQAYYGFNGSLSGGGSTVSIDGDSIFKGTAIASCLFRCSRHSFGAGIKNSDDAQFAISRSRTDD